MILIDFLYVFFALQVGYYAMLVLAALLIPKNKYLGKGKPTPYAQVLPFYKVAIIIPVYQEDQIIRSTVADALRKVAGTPHEVFVLADGLQPSTELVLQEMGAHIWKMVFEHSTKGRSLHAAATRLSATDHTHVLVLDADNLMDAKIFDKLEGRLCDAHRIVQMHRTAKNLQTPMAYLDALSESIANTTFRNGAARLGLSASISGSGMLFQKAVFQGLMEKLNLDLVYEDKVMEMDALMNGEYVYYFSDIDIFDEKVSRPQDFSRQRGRWMSAQVGFLALSTSHVFSNLTKLNLPAFHKWINAMALPKLILAAVVFVTAGLEWAITRDVGRWSLLLLTLAVAYFAAIPKKLWSRDMLSAIAYLPKAFWFLLLALTRIGKRSTKQFEVTPKGVE